MTETWRVINFCYAFGMIFKFCEIGQRMTDAFDDFYVLMG